MNGILVVNANGDESKSLVEALSARGCQVDAVGSLKDALKSLADKGWEHVLTSRTLPDGSGELLAQQVADVAPRTQVTLVTNFSHVRAAADILRFDFTDYILDVDDLAGIIAAGRSSVAPSQKDLVQCFLRTIEAIVGLMELSNPLMAGNAASSCRLAEGIAQELGLGDQQRQEIALASLLHDIGNFSVGPAVLGKSDPLVPAEEDVIRQHTTRGSQIFDHVDFPWKIKPIILHHHERYDGTGYPGRKKGREIPIGSRILAVVDSYLAMTTARPHRQTLSHDAAVQEIESQVGTQFDPEIVEAFSTFIEKRRRFSGDAFQVKILVIGQPDGPLARLKLQFLREDFKVLMALEVGPAMETIYKEDVRFVIADVTHWWHEALPLLDGLQERIEAGKTDVLFFDGEDLRDRRVTALDNGTEEVFPLDVSPSEVISRLRRILRKEQAARKSSKDGALKAGGIEGDLAEMSLAELLQMLSMGQKTARVGLESKKVRGALFVEGGRLTHAECGGEDGPAALTRLLALSTGRFRLVHGVTTDKRSVDRDAMAVLLDTLREMDESGDSPRV